MPLSAQLADEPGQYIGTGQGIESGPFESRINVTVLPNGAIAIDYEAISAEVGPLHFEHTILAPGPDGRDRLYVAHSETPFVSEMVETEPNSRRFVQAAPFGPYTMEIVIETPEKGRITYAWWWASVGEPPVEQSKADASLAS